MPGGLFCTTWFKHKLLASTDSEAFYTLCDPSLSMCTYTHGSWPNTDQTLTDQMLVTFWNKTLNMGQVRACRPRAAVNWMSFDKPDESDCPSHCLDSFGGYQYADECNADLRCVPMEARDPSSNFVGQRQLKLEDSVGEDRCLAARKGTITGEICDNSTAQAWTFSGFISPSHTVLV